MPFLKDLQYKRPSNAPPQTQCQKCLGYGHFTYECQRPRAYVYRPSRTQQVKHKKKAPMAIIDPATIPGNLPSNPLQNVADAILEEKEKQRKMQQADKMKLPRSDDEDSESHEDTSCSESASDDDTSSTASVASSASYTSSHASIFSSRSSSPFVARSSSVSSEQSFIGLKRTRSEARPDSKRRRG